MDSDTPLVASPRPPRRVSQDPRRLCRRAPSPIVPNGSMGASARCFPIDGRLRHLRKVGRRHWCNETESGSRTLGSRLRSLTTFRVVRPAAIARPDRSVSRIQLPVYAGPSYMLNEQFTWLTPFSQQESPELTWRDRSHEVTKLNPLAERIIGCAIEVHKALGPELLESIYETALCIELEDAGLPYTRQVPVPAFYKGQL